MSWDTERGGQRKGAEMTEWDADAAVVGLGAWGASALWRMAARGLDVVGVEQFQPGHSLGSSHGGSRMFRITCLEHPHLVPLARRSLQLWQDLAAASGVPLFEPSGGLLLGPAAGRIVGGTLRAAEQHGIEIERLSSAAVRERFPQHASLPPGDIGIWEPSAGILRPEAAIGAAVGQAVAAGATALPGTRVRSVELIPGGAIVRTALKDIRVRQVVLAVGSWLSKLISNLPLQTLRMPITWYQVRADQERFGLAAFPVFMRELPGGSVLWGNGSDGGDPVKLGLEVYGSAARPLDPDTDDRSVTSDDWSGLAKLLPAYLPGLEPVPVKVSVCMLTRTPDGQFVIGRPGGDPRLVVAGGCNAHGFKHAAGIGEALADIVQGKPPRMTLDFVRPDRFTRS